MSHKIVCLCRLIFREIRVLFRSNANCEGICMFFLKTGEAIFGLTLLAVALV